MPGFIVDTQAKESGKDPLDPEALQVNNNYFLHYLKTSPITKNLPGLQGCPQDKGIFPSLRLLHTNTWIVYFPFCPLPRG